MFFPKKWKRKWNNFAEWTNNQEMHFHLDTSKVDCFRLSYLSLIPHHLVSFTHTSYLTKAYSAPSWHFLVHFHPFHSSIRVKFAFKFEYFDQQKSRKRVPLSKRPTKEYSNFNFRSWKTLVFHIHQTIFFFPICMYIISFSPPIFSINIYFVVDSNTTGFVPHQGKHLISHHGTISSSTVSLPVHIVCQICANEWERIEKCWWHSNYPACENAQFDENWE